MDALTGFREGGRTVVLPNADMQLVSLSGPDAQRFLQNRTSNDVDALSPGQGHWNAVLNKKAQIEGIFFLLAHPSQPSTYWLMVDNAMAENTLSALLQFKLLEDFDVTPMVNYRCVVCAGASVSDVLSASSDIPSSVAVLPPHTSQVHVIGGEDVVVVKQSTTGEPEVWFWFPEKQGQSFVSAMTEQPGVAMVSAHEWSVLALEGGYPQVNSDYALGTLMPETGWEQWAASYSKGCYLGQETIARVKTYGAVQQAQVVLAVPAELSTQPDKVKGAHIQRAESGERIGKVHRLFYSPALQQWAVSATLGKDWRIPGSSQLISFTTEEGQTVAGPCEVVVHLLPLVSGASQQSRAAVLRDEGLTAFANNQSEDAIRLLRQSLMLDASQPDALEALGAVLGRQGQYKEAAALMQQLTVLDPERVMGWTNLSVYYMHLGDKEKAEEAKAQATVVAMRQKMAASGLKPSEEVNQAAEQARIRQLEERVELFKEALAHSPDDPLGNFGLGSTLLELSRFEDAVWALEKTVGLSSSQSAAYAKLAHAYENTGQLEKAIHTYREGIMVASRRRDLQPLKEMEHQLARLQADYPSLATV